jgi:hypothetical protein
MYTKECCRVYERLINFLLVIFNDFYHFKKQAKVMTAKIQMESDNEPLYWTEEKLKVKSKKQVDEHNTQYRSTHSHLIRNSRCKQL